MTTHSPLLPLAQLMKKFQQTTEGLANCKRWAHYQRAYKQDSLSHSFSLAILAYSCSQREIQLGGAQLDSARLTIHALVHDFGERITGDVTFLFKKDPRIRHLHQIIEDEATQHLLGEFETLNLKICEAYFLDPNSVEARYFDALEKLDYVLYAAYEIVEHGHTAFIDVFARQHEDLIKYAEEFPSIAEFYTPAVQQHVVDMVKQAKLPPHTRISKTQSHHALDMLNALQELLTELRGSDQDISHVADRLTDIAEQISGEPV